MDYCHPCRRHLNGALACPGCGTPAEACRRYAEEMAAADAAAGTDEVHDDGAREPRRSRRTVGRSRRRRTQRRRTRALVLGAGFMIAAGGIAVAQLGGETPPQNHAAPSQPTTTPGAGDTQDTGDAGEPSQSASDKGRANRSNRTSTSPAPGTSTATPSKSPGSKTKKPSDRPTKSPEEDASSPPPTSERPPSQPATTPPPEPSDPQPTPSETCTRFLWWCT
ncbi:SCO2400 family protein [Streptomyces monticola]